MPDLERHPDDTAGRALFDSIGLMPGAVALIVFGSEQIDKPLPLPAIAVMALGGLLSAISGKRWQDFHAFRDQRSTH